MSESKPGLGYMLWFWRQWQIAPAEDDLRDYGATDEEIAVLAGKVPDAR